MLRLVLALTLLAAALGCTRDRLESPQDVVLVLETNIRMTEHDAEVAVRVRDLEALEALVHVACENGDDTVIARHNERSDEVCGLAFELVEYRIRDNEPHAAVLRMHFDDGTPDEPAAEEASDEASGSADEGA